MESMTAAGSQASSDDFAREPHIAVRVPIAPTAAAEMPAAAAEPPTDAADMATDAADMPRDTADMPAAATELPTDAAEMERSADAAARQERKRFRVERRELNAIRRTSEEQATHTQSREQRRVEKLRNRQQLAAMREFLARALGHVQPEAAGAPVPCALPPPTMSSEAAPLIPCALPPPTLSPEAAPLIPCALPPPPMSPEAAPLILVEASESEDESLPPAVAASEAEGEALPPAVAVAAPKNQPRQRLPLSDVVKNQYIRLGALMGKTIVFTQQYRRGKRKVPSTRLEVVSIKREKERFAVSLEGINAAGDSVTHRDWIKADEDPEERYELAPEGQEIIPLQPEAFAAFFVSSVGAGAHAQKTVEDGSAKPLLSILPRFRHAQASSCENIVAMGDTHEAELQQLLVHKSQLFFNAGPQSGDKQGRIWRAQTAAGVKYDTDVEDVRLRVRQLLHIDATREDVFVGRTLLPPGLSRVGNQPLLPWQAWFYAQFLAMVQQPDALRELLATRHWKGNWVRGLATRPKKLLICVAPPGNGKTRVGCLCAAGRKTCVVVPPGLVRHWEREAEMVGVKTVQVGNDGWRPKDLKEKLDHDNENLMWIVTRPVLQNYLKASSSARDIVLFPTPELLIIDEFHDPPPHARKLLDTWPEAITLGFSGTFSHCEVHDVAKDLSLDEDVLEATTLRVPLHAIRGEFPLVQCHVKRVDMSPLEMACYQAGCSWMSSAERQRLLVFSPKPREEGRQGHRENYGQGIWETIVQQLQQAEKEVFTKLAKILSHVLVECRAEELRTTISRELGDEALSKIWSLAQLVPPGGAAWNPGEVDRQVQAAFAKRRAILGGYVYLRRQLDTISDGSEIECPVCLERTAQWRMANCGHLVCESCACRTEVRRRCPTCRVDAPSWKSPTELAQIRSAVEPQPFQPELVPAEADPQGEDIVSSMLDTSNKLKALASLLLGLGRSERALVICPAQLLKVVQTEMQRVNVNLGILAGGSQEQEATQATWAAGKSYRGLLAAPGILGIDVYASTIIFLTNAMSGVDYRQALARVKRQGNPAAAKKQPVRAWFIVYRGTEEDTSENLEAKIRIAEENVNTASASSSS